MAAPAISLAERFTRPETTDVYLLDSVTSPSGAATRQELDGGINLVSQIFSADGFVESANFIDTPDWGSLTTTQIVGRSGAISGTLTLYADKDGDDIRDELDRLDNCVIVFMDAGDVPGGYMDVFRCQVGSIAPTREGDDAVKVAVQLAVRQVHERVVIPAEDS